MNRALRRVKTPRVLALSGTLLAGVLLAAGQVTGQAAASAPPAAETPAPQTPSPSGYTYNPQGRRDPFVSLLNRGTDARASVAVRPEGLAGLTVDEVALRGIVQGGGRFVAMIQAPDGKSYTIKAGDRLLDGTVKAITSTAVVFVQQVDDPLSLVKHREIRKPLRPTEEGK
jgi:Tfp pilus assembly protein PilP